MDMAEDSDGEEELLAEGAILKRLKEVFQRLVEEGFPEGEHVMVETVRCSASQDV